MRWFDLLTLPCGALWRQKVRTLLTTLGVVFGAFVLAATLSIGEGVQHTIDRLIRQTDFLRRIEVRQGTTEDVKHPEQVAVEGDLSAERKDRLKPLLATHQAQVNAGERVPLNQVRVEEIRRIPKVETFVPSISVNGFAQLEGNLSDSVSIGAFHPRENDYADRLLAGRFFDKPDEKAVVVSEFLLYRMGCRAEEDYTAALGKMLRFEALPRPQRSGMNLFLSKGDGSPTSREESALVETLTRQLPILAAQLKLSPEEAAMLAKFGLNTLTPQAIPERRVLELKIVGITRVPATIPGRRPRWNPFQSGAELLIPPETALEFAFASPEIREEGLGTATLVMQREEDVAAAVSKLEDLGLSAWAPLDFIDRQRTMHRLIFGSMSLVAAVALFVAALGIANTMLMSVLERTREIGVMKAIGASDSALQALFLIEGSIIGLTGGVLGLLLAWAGSIPGDRWVRSMASANVRLPLNEPLFEFPLWLNVLVIAFAAFVTTLGAYYPARHAARIDPVCALRHE